MKKILDAAELEMPPLVMVTSETESTADTQTQGYKVQNQESHVLAKGWTPEHCQEVLQSQVKEILTAMMESCGEVGAWVMPEAPRRRNGAARIICDTISETGNVTTIGAIGLTTEQGDAALKEGIESTMVPVGSPIEKVCSIRYDDSAEDDAPCPNLSKFLIFENPHELRIWHEHLLSVAPDILVMFGDITENALDTAFKTAVSGSPIVLLKHTGTEVDNACRMFRHVKKYLPTGARGMAGPGANDNGGGVGAVVAATKAMASKVQTTVTAAAKAGTEALVTTNDGGAAVVGGSGGASSAPSSSSGSQKRLLLPAIPDMEDEKINLFVSTWPADFNTATVVVADPLLLTGKSFQKKMLAAITASFDLKVGSEELRRAKHRALDYAWSFHDVAERQTKAKKFSAEVLHAQLVLFTLSSISASVFYNEFYGSHSPKNTAELFLFVATIIIPLYITSLKQESEKSNPAIRWRAFKVATARLESEIFKFRCQVGPYRADEKSESAMRLPLTRFSENTSAIWEAVHPFLADDEMDIPPDFWEASSPIGDLAKLSKAAAADAQAIAAGGGSSTLDGVATSRNIDIEAQAAATESTTLLQRSAVGSSTPAPSSSPTPDAPLTTMTVEDDDDPDPPTMAELGDDHYSPLTADDYIELRMKTIMQNKNDELKKVVRRNDRISSTIKIVTVFSGATAALSLQWLVPIVLGLTALLSAGQEFRKYRQRIEMGNDMITTLNKLKLWWMRLSMYQRQLPLNKDKLVIETERAIVTELSAVAIGSNAQ